MKIAVKQEQITSDKNKHRYQIISLLLLAVGAIGLLLPMGAAGLSVTNKVPVSVSFRAFVQVALDLNSALFIGLSALFVVCYILLVVLSAVKRPQRLIGIASAALLSVFIIGVFPEVHKMNPVRGMDFGVGFFITLGALLLYTLNAHVMAKNDYDAVVRDFRMNKWLIFLSIPVVVYYFLFSYAPMYGVIIGFKNFSAIKGILASEWVGVKHLASFFTSVYFNRTVTNTFLISVYQLIFGFPAPIILALLLNEVKNRFFKRTIQTVTYLPHFISLVVICGIIVDFFSLNGLVNNILSVFGVQRHMFMSDPNAYRSIYVGSGIWQTIGWGSIIYLAALSGINQELYEATAIEGAGRFKQFLHVTLPGIVPIIVIMLILNVGSLMSEGSEKTILLYNELTYDTADTISSYTYRRGLVQGDFSYSSAVGLFNTVINLILLVSANQVSRRVGETSLW